tara:strand:+ start:164 stop:1441 length:1278 start_codon:yes stop_codon:yes gene_type:complete
MATPTLTPSSTTSAIVLTSTGSTSAVSSALPFGTYTSTDYWVTAEVNLFISGASDQVAHVYKKMGGDVLDIELTNSQVYASYEEACLEYSYIVNMHQSKNILSNVLGATTGTFDQDGQIRETSGNITGDTNLNTKYPKFDFAYARRVTEGVSEEVNIGGSETVYSASISIAANKQDYDLQDIFAGSGADYEALADGQKILIKKVYYKTTQAMWNFYGYYGAVNVVGNLANYGQYSDSSTFELVPVWQQKLQSMAFEDSIKTRTSDFGYELKNNKLRLFPTPSSLSPTSLWVEFTIPKDAWVESSTSKIGIGGVNNMSNIPFQNLPYKYINAIGKQWIRRYSLALCKEMLGYTRSKFSSIPIPGNEITLNGSELVTQAQAELTALRDELKTTLDELTYDKLMESDAGLMENSVQIMQKVPLSIYVG